MRKIPSPIPVAPRPAIPLGDTSGHRRASELIALLEDIILNDGFAKLSVAAMAERLGCSKRTLYELAASKNELVLAIVAQFFARIRSDAADAIKLSKDPTQQIYDYLQVGVRAAQRLSAAAVTDMHQWEPARSVWQEHMRLRVQGLCELIGSGVAAGVFRDINPKLVAELVFASISRLREPDFYASTNISISEAFQAYYGMLLAALLPDNSRRRVGREATRERRRLHLLSD